MEVILYLPLMLRHQSAKKQEKGWEKIEVIFTKGQLNSKSIYKVIVTHKNPTKNYRGFCPTL